jgi:hypothetical protein
MKARTLHKVFGIVLLLPFLAWAATGFVFFLKPGYAGAYEILTPKTYPLDSATAINPDPGWLEYRYLKTVLGEHLIVRTEKGWVQLNPIDRQPKRAPTRAEFELLLKDAFTADPARYGQISDISGTTAMTSTGVEVSIDWNSLKLQQHGRDTDRIDLLYRIHYLQWTGIRTVDKVLGFVGLTLVILLTLLGAWLAIGRR